jgi:hypothetical protein
MYQHPPQLILPRCGIRLLYRMYPPSLAPASLAAPRWRCYSVVKSTKVVSIARIRGRSAAMSSQQPHGFCYAQLLLPASVSAHQVWEGRNFHTPSVRELNHRLTHPARLCALSGWMGENLLHFSTNARSDCSNCIARSLNGMMSQTARLSVASHGMPCASKAHRIVQTR